MFASLTISSITLISVKLKPLINDGPNGNEDP